MNINNVQIFAVGKWNDTTITGRHLQEMARNQAALKEKLRVPLKFGHNDEQPLTDGQPALGWVTNLRVEGKKLLADFEQVPQLVFDSIKAGRFDRVSVEVRFGVEVAGKPIGTVLTGVALLGADLPAVSDLEGLAALVATQNDLLQSNYSEPDKVFTWAIPPEEMGVFKGASLSETHSPEKKAMSDELQAQIDELKKLVKGQADEKATFQARAEAAEAKVAEAEIDAEKKIQEGRVTLFTSTRTALLAKCEEQVKAGTMTPAIRDAIQNEVEPQVAEFKEGRTKLLFSETTLLLAMASEKLPAGEQGAADGGDAGKPVESADVLVANAVVKYQADNEGAEYGEAVTAVLEADPKLSEAYGSWLDNSENHQTN